MTWTKATPVLVVCAIFDALRFMCEMFWFFGPALAAAYCAAHVGDTLASWTFGLLGTKTAAIACSATAAALGAAAVEITAPLGVILAIAVGLVGWLTIGLWIVMTNSRILKENEGNAIWFVASLLISEIPIVDVFPALTVTVWRMYRVQIRKEKKALQEYEKKHADEQRQEHNQQTAELMQARGEQEAQIAQTQAQEAADAEAAANQQLPASIPEFGSASIKMSPAPQLVTVPNYTGRAANEEIPEKVRKAA